MAEKRGNSPDTAQRDVLRTLVTALKLSFAFGALVFFLYGILSTYAFVTYLQEDTIDDFLDGFFYLTGLGAADDTVTLLPLGLTGEWQSVPPLPDDRTDLAAVASDNRIFVIGGFKWSGTLAPSYKTEIYSTTVTEPYTGTINGWTKIGDLPRGLAGHRAVLHPTTAQTSTLFVLGGTVYDSGDEVSVDTIYRAVIDNATGALVGDVVTDTGTLPVSMRYHSVVLRGNTLYVIGGSRLEPYNDKTFDTVYKASISSTGVLGVFLETASLPVGLRNAAAVLFSGPTTDTIYVMGGTEEGGFNEQATPTNAVLYGDINPATGGVTSWQQAFGMAAPVWGHAGVIVNGGGLFALRGRTGSAGSVVVFATVQSAMADEDDPQRILNWCGTPTCDRWQSQQGDSLLDSRSEGAGVAVGNHLYYIGGVDGVGQERREVFRSAVGGLGGLEQMYFYAPAGYYLSNPVDLDSPYSYDRNQIYGLSWRVFLSNTDVVSLAMKYRFWDFGQTPITTWAVASPFISQDDGGGYRIYTASINSAYTNTRYFQYKAEMRTMTFTLTPRLDWVRIYYDVPDPEVRVVKLGPPGIYPQQTISYSIYYTASGGVPAPNIVLTDTKPHYTAYSDSPGWSLISGDAYTYFVGTKGSYGSGSYSNWDNPVVLKVTAPDEFPAGETNITNVVEINYPLFQDTWGNVISDPVKVDNVFTNVMPIYRASWDVSKSAEPYPQIEVGSQRPVITYTITYTYTGNQTETGYLVISDTLPNQIDAISYSPGGQLIGKTLTWQRDATQIGPGQSGVVTVTAWVTRPIDNGTQFANRTWISSDHTAPKASDWITHTVVSTPTLTLYKSAAPPDGGIALANSTIQYTVTLTNTGGMKAHSVVITDVVDSSKLNIVSYPGAVLIGDNTLRWPASGPRSELTVDSPWVVTFTARVGTVFKVTVANQAEADCEEKPPIVSNVVTHTVPDMPVLSIVKEDNVSEVSPGEVLTYVISFSNTNPGSAPVTRVRITDTYPTAVIEPLASVDWQACGSGCRYHVYEGEEVTQTARTVEFAVRVTDTAPLGLFSNRVDIWGDNSAAPDTDSHENLVVLRPNVAIAKDDGLSTVTPGEYITYSIVCRNFQPVAYELTLTETLPDGLRYVGYGWQPGGGNVYTRPLRFSPGATQTLHVFAQVNAGAPAGPLINTVSMGGGPYVRFQNAISDTDTTVVEEWRDLDIYKTDSSGVARPGQVITYTIYYTNVGNVVMSNVRITDTLVSGLTYLSGTCNWYEIASGTYVADIGELVPGEVGQCTLNALVNELVPSYAENVASIGGDQSEDDWSNNVFTDTDYVTADDTAVDLYLITITTNPITPTVGKATNIGVRVYSQTVGVTELELPENETVIGELRLPRPPAEGELGAQATCDDWNRYVYVAIYVDPYKEPRYPDDTWYDYIGIIEWPFAGNNASVSKWWTGSAWQSASAVSHQFTAPGWHTLYAQADMWDPEPEAVGCVPWKRSYGHVPEANELNNIGSLLIYAEPQPDESGGVYLPFIVKGQ